MAEATVGLLRQVVTLGSKEHRGFDFRRPPQVGNMKQYHITTANFDHPQENDCVLAEDDPLNGIKKSIMLGGLGMQQAIANQKYSAAIKRYFADKEETMPKN